VAAAIMVGVWLAQLTGDRFMADFTVAVTGGSNRRASDSNGASTTAAAAAKTLRRLPCPAVTSSVQKALQGMEAHLAVSKGRMVVPAILLIWMTFLVVIGLCFANGIAW
jgi:hypothetical protein